MLRIDVESFVSAKLSSSHSKKKNDDRESHKKDEEDEDEDGEYVTGVMLRDGTSLHSKHVVIAPEYIEHMLMGTFEDKERLASKKDTHLSNETLCRCVLITNRLLPNITTDKCVVVVPPGEIENKRTISIVQLSSQVSVVPGGKYLVHMTTTVPNRGDNEDCGNGGETGEVILRRAVDLLYGTTNHGTGSATFLHPMQDPIEWSGYFHHASTRRDYAGGALPTNVHCRRNVRITACGAPVDVDAAFSEARRLFFTLCPEKKFLPERIDPNASTTSDGTKEGEEDDTSDMSGLDSDDDYGV
jgi:hypothetical protein